MHKRILSLGLCICLLFCLISCGDSPSNESSDNISVPETLPDGSYYSTNVAGQKEWKMKSVPFTMDFGGKEAELCDIDFFELYADHGYTAWVVITIDRQNLTDDDLYWITKPGTGLHKDLDVSVSNTKIDGTNVEVIALNEAGGIYTDKYIYYAFCSDLNRYSYLGERFSCTIYYSPESMVNPDGVSYWYYLDVNEDNYSDSPDVLTEDAAKALHQLLT